AATLVATTGNVKVDTVSAVGDVNVTAAQSIGGKAAARYAQVESTAGSVTLNAGTDISGDLTRAAQNVQATAARDLDATTTTAFNGTLTARATTGSMTLGTANAETALTLTGGTGITAGTLSTDAGMINATASTGDLSLGSTNAAGAATLVATTGNVKVDTVSAVGDVNVTAAQSIGGKAAARYARVESTAGSVTLNAGTDISGDLTRAQDGLTLGAANSIDVTTVASVAGNVSVEAGAGNVVAGTLTAERNLTIKAGSNIRVGSAVSSLGNTALSAANDVTADLVSADNGDATLDALNGTVNVRRVLGDGVLLYAKTEVDGANLEVGRRLVLLSDRVTATVNHLLRPGRGALSVSLVGRNRPIMNTVDLTLNSPLGVSFDRFLTRDARITIPTGFLELQEGYVGNRMLLNTPSISLLMDNSSSVVQRPYDAQLFAPTGAFSMRVEQNLSRVLGAYIIHRDPATHPVVSDPTGYDSSVLETGAKEGVKTSRVIVDAATTAQRPSGVIQRAVGELVQVPENAVQLEPATPVDSTTE
ncbi:MAG: hypothetical protein ING94_17700, partial [Rhodocyclaceae bacterium]|nr:hypothetical protein [Rhodocyclaceae bacterium]